MTEAGVPSAGRGEGGLSGIGTSVRRLEDPRILRGASEYVDDVPAADALHVALVRSQYGHARLAGIRTEAAARMPGVAAVVTGEDLGPANGPFAHPTWFDARPALKAAIDAMLQPEVIRLLAVERARFAGEPIVAVVADDRYRAEDAARLVEVDYEPLPAIVDPERAEDAGAPLVNPDWGTNRAGHFRVMKGNPEAAFRGADVVVRGRFTIPRQTGAPIEARGVVARPDRRTGGLTVWSSTQAPHWLRDALVASLGLAENQLRVIAPDVGGGFGVKSMVYPEELLVCLLARRLGRAVKWIDTRTEHFLSSIQSRSQRHDVELALRTDGTILGLRDRYLVDAGVSNVEALVVPYNTTAHLQGTYRIPALEVECTIVVTNKAPLSAYRGAGRPEAVFAMERILDRAARALALDPVELRRRNTITADEMPFDAGILYRDGNPLVLDGGDYVACLDRAVEEIGVNAFRRDQAAAREAGRYLGFGVATYVEGTGVGPYEIARVTVEPSGGVVVTVALPSQGQGHQTTLAQLVAAQLGIPLERIRVVQGDTLALAYGGGTIASRTAVVVGNAVHEAARIVRERALALAADALEASVTDLRLEDGRAVVAGSPDRGISLGALARRVAPGVGRLDDSRALALEAQAAFEPQTVTFANGVHAAIVEVDPATGFVRVIRYVVVHDCGRVINPMIVDGQVVGGVAQGIGGALLEQLLYDEGGQLLGGSYMDYGMPRATDLPPIEVVHLETASTRNPLGFKGVGEAGTIAAGPAIAAAVEDALAPFGVSVDAYPLTPEVVHRLAGAGARSGPA